VIRSARLARSQRKTEPEELGAILTRWLSATQAAERLGEDGIFQKWRDIVGEDVGAATRVVKCAGGVLTVEVASAPLLNELSSFRREEILELVRAREEFRGIHDIRFRAGAARDGRPVTAPGLASGRKLGERRRKG
jgi:hypothetical protein